MSASKARKAATYRGARRAAMMLEHRAIKRVNLMAAITYAPNLYEKLEAPYRLRRTTTDQLAQWIHKRAKELGLDEAAE